MKRAEVARGEKDIVKFKKYVYRAEDAWKKLVILKQKQEKNG
jgi:hypothetical protein